MILKLVHIWLIDNYLWEMKHNFLFPMIDFRIAKTCPHLVIGGAFLTFHVCVVVFEALTSDNSLWELVAPSRVGLLKWALSFSFKIKIFWISPSARWHCIRASWLFVETVQWLYLKQFKRWWVVENQSRMIHPFPIFRPVHIHMEEKWRQHRGLFLYF